MRNNPIKVMCVDDNRDITGLIKLSISAEPDMQMLGCLYQADGLVDEVCRTGAEIVLLDLIMPGKDPLEALREVRDQCPSTRIIVFSGRDDFELVDSALHAGAWGFVPKSKGVQTVIEAIRKVAKGEFALGD